MEINWQKSIGILKKNRQPAQAGIVVLPTDTIYGIVASVNSKKAEESIYKIKAIMKRIQLFLLFVWL